MCFFSKAIPVALEGAGRDARGWFELGEAQVYHDHFIRAQLEGGVVVDFLKTAGNTQLQLCMELSVEAARALGQALLETVAQMPEEARMETKVSVVAGGNAS